MYTLTRQLGLKLLVAEQLPAIGVSILVAELFYKFHSFTLECLAFLATWYVADLTIQSLRRALGEGDRLSTR